MGKKLIMSSMAIAAFAFAFVIAPAASASTATSNGVVVPVGTSVTAKNTGSATFTGAFNVVCSTVHTTGTLGRNNTSVITIEEPVGNAQLTGTGTNSDCTSALGSTSVTVNSKLCLETAAGDVIKTTGCGGNVVFTLTITGTGPCKYGTSSLSGTYSTNSTPPIYQIAEQEAKLTEGGIFCPSSGKWDITWDWYTTDGTGLTFS